MVTSVSRPITYFSLRVRFGVRVSRWDLGDLELDFRVIVRVIGVE